MLEIAPITPELLDALGKELGGCDFGHASHQAFLASTETCDVQAAPGNGKTTLLAAKLALLSRTWTSRRQGVCVISHTNAARSEVEDLIAKHPSAAQLMAYPHFTGTVTAFINQYLALPYLRGVGWPIRQIDDDVFEAEALRRYSDWSALKWHATNKQRPALATVEAWVGKLELDPDFVNTGPEPQSLAVRRIKGQHGPGTKCGDALAELKAAMVRRGLYRYGDMTAVAWRALKTTPGLADRLRARFPLVILDEAQDTNGAQMRLLEFLFKDGAAFQRLGDSNQTLYEDASLGAADYWTPGANSIPLDETRRFGADIAGFASRLTARKSQVIVGDPTLASTRALFVFDEATIGEVIEAFAAEARGHWGDQTAGRTLWAVASRQSIPGRKKGAWSLKSLVDYHPTYRAESSPPKTADRFCRQLQKAALHHTSARPPTEVAEMMAAGIAGLCNAYGWKTAHDRLVTGHTVWSTLSARDAMLPRKVRRLLRDHVLAGSAPWTANAWEGFLGNLLPLFGAVDNAILDHIADHCVFVAGQQIDVAAPPSAKKEARFGDVTVRMGSVHSVKGKSVDGILLVESEVWKGPAAADQCIDLETVLPHAFSLTNQVFTGTALTAATNVFVAVTRPRELLGLAVRATVATPQLRAAAQAQGWKLVDLVAIAAARSSQTTAP